MNIIKLDAIDSTNDYLKELSRAKIVDNFTIVTTENQTKGKGQMGSVWKSEIGKNLTMSILIKDVLLNVNQIFDLNIAISLSVIEVLQEYSIPKLTIKWPNDIMSENKKIGGILIENSFKTDNKIESVVGIGLNVNQNHFLDLPKASSLTLISSLEYDLVELISKIFLQIKFNCKNLIANKIDLLWEKYHQNLFKKGVPMPFEAENETKFMGIMLGVTKEGKLEILLEDDSLKTFGIKEIAILY
ncbi:biotin--[acetyl-CoA-carboxylase] ligase [Flavobacterium sp.]|uniref:biotin--[acetyl-CoA-carboxylase] ligase n=1 Tax=Flavobacterium sp. TaxID=239 RepID=UPI003750705E